MAAEARLPLAHAVALGLVQGPAELLPVSSSGHLVLLPALTGSPYARLDPELRKAFEVALHLGGAAALLVALRAEVGEVVRELDARRAAHIGLTFAPAGAAALVLERAIERRLGAPRPVAAAQVAAGAALALADLCPAVRGRDDARWPDHLIVGLAQACALAPGVSRNGATLTAARLRGFTRPAANRLSRHAALPIILAAAALKGVRLARGGLAPSLRAPFAFGAVAAFGSTLAGARLIERMDAARSYLPFAAYRVALGLVALRALERRAPRWRGQGSRPARPPTLRASRWARIVTSAARSASVGISAIGRRS